MFYIFPTWISIDKFPSSCRSVGVVFLSMGINDCGNRANTPVAVELNWEDMEGRVGKIGEANVTALQNHYTFPINPQVLPHQARYGKMWREKKATTLYSILVLVSNEDKNYAALKILNFHFIIPMLK